MCPVVVGSRQRHGAEARNTLSIWAKFGPLLERLLGKRLEVRYGDWRPGDQPVYISDITMAERELNWKPAVAVEDGIERLVRWVEANRELFGRPLVGADCDPPVCLSSRYDR